MVVTEKAKQRRYSAEEKSAVLRHADEVGVVVAATEAGIPEGTVSNRRFYQRRRTSAVEMPATQSVPAAAGPEIVAPAEETAPASDAKRARRVAKSYTPSQRAEILEYAAKHGITAAAREFDTTRFSIYS